MATPLDLLKQRCNDDWVIGFSSQELYAIAHQTLQDLQAWHSTHSPTHPLTLLLTDPDSFHFLADFIAACSFPCSLVLCNPTWAEAEWQQVIELTQPDLVLGKGDGRWEMGEKGWQKLEGGRREAKGEEKYQKQGTHKDVSNSPTDSLSPSPSLYSPTPRPPQSPTPNPQPPHPLILIPTGGSSGTIRFAMHTWNTLAASVTGFQQHFAVEQVNSLCVLPLYHVSGLMQFMRSLLSGGKLAIVPFKSLQAGTFPPLPPEPFFLSLVPTQLHRLIPYLPSSPNPDLQPRTDVSRNVPSSPPTPNPLSSLPPFTILLGGAPAWKELLKTARSHHLPIAPTYGMTETAAQIATLKPEEFLQGRSGCGRVLPHARVTIRDEAGNPLAANQVGQVELAAKSLMLGYFPHASMQPEFLTEDLGFLDEAGYLHIVGRRDCTIITGGENVFPAEVEAAIRASGLVKDVYVLGTPDPDWGQAVTAVYVPVQDATGEKIKAAIASQLCRYKHPKHWIAVEEMPRNAQGKINRQQVMALLGHALLSQSRYDPPTTSA